MPDESLTQFQQDSLPSTAPTGKPDPWFALRGADGMSFVLPDTTVLRLLRILTQPSTEVMREQLLLQLAYDDPSWAAWLASVALGNVSSRLLGLTGADDPPRLSNLFPAVDGVFGAADWQTDGDSSAGCESSGARRTRPLDWQLIDRRVGAMIRDPRFTVWLASRIAAVHWSSQEVQVWWRARHRAAALCRSVADVEWPNDQIREASFWWALVFASCPDVGTLAVPPRQSRIATEWDDFVRVFRAQRTVVQRESLDDDAFHEPPRPSHDIAVLFRQTLDRLQQAERLEQRFDAAVEQAKLSAMKELAYGASHEINNPLANISSRAQMLLRGEVDPKRRQSLATINRQAFRAHEMLADMMLFAKPPALELKRIEWNDFCAETLSTLRELLADADTTTDVELRIETSTRPAFVNGDATQLVSALHTLWRNAIEAVGDCGVIVWRATVVDACPGEANKLWAELELCDSGPGIPPDVRQHVFDPFYSGREAGRGLGFGLSKAWRIVQLHQGQIMIADGRDRMTSLTIRIPATDKMVPATEVQATRT